MRLLKSQKKEMMAFFAFRSHPTSALATPAQSLGTAPSSPAAWPRPPLGGQRGGRRRRRRRRGAEQGPAGVDQVRKAPYSLQIILIIIFLSKIGDFFYVTGFFSRNSQELPPQKNLQVFFRQGGVKYKFFSNLPIGWSKNGLWEGDLLEENPPPFPTHASLFIFPCHYCLGKKISNL